MPASSTTNRFAPGNCLTSTTRVSSTPAGPTSTRPGSIATFKPLPRVACDERAHVLGRIRAPGRRRRRCRARRRCRGVRARCPRRGARGASATTASAARCSGSSDVICEPMCTCTPTGCSPRRAGNLAEQRRRFVDGDAELVGLESGGNVGMAPGVDVGVDAQRDARHGALRDRARWSMRSSSPGDSTLMASSPSATARSISAALLPTPVNTISSGRKPHRMATSTSPSELASAALPSAAHQPNDAERRIGLQRVVNGMRAVAERVVQAAVGGADAVGVVDVDGRADGGGDRPRVQCVAGWRSRREWATASRAMRSCRRRNATGRPARDAMV